MKVGSGLIRGVNKRIIEVNGQAGDFFEKALFVMRSDPTKRPSETQLIDYLSDLDCPPLYYPPKEPEGAPQKKKTHKRFLKRLLFGVTLVLFGAAATLLLRMV